MSEYKLAAEIIARSVSNNWDQAKLEWKLYKIYEAVEPETCLCGHHPIIELCILVNTNHGELATVGNCCVKKFIGLPSDKIFTAVKRVRKDETKSLNAETIAFAFEKGWINKWEHDFYFDIMRKRNLSPKQSIKKSQINAKVLQYIKR
jgi:hypothetical protein